MALKDTTVNKEQSVESVGNNSQPIKARTLVQIQLPLELVPVGKVIEIDSQNLLNELLNANAIEVLP